MAETRRVGSLEICQDLDFEHRQWRVQHAAWIVILVLLIAGLLGAFGGGLLSHAEATSGSLVLSYERLTRHRAPAELRLRIAPGTTDGAISIWINQTFVESVDVARVTPEPLDMAAGEERIVYRFALEDPAQPATIIIAYQPVSKGLRHIQLGVVGGAELAVDQYVYP